MKSLPLKPLLIIAAFSAWITMTSWIGPKLVRDGYEGKSFGAVNAFIAARRSTRPPEFYLDKLNSLTRNSLFVAGLAGLSLVFIRREQNHGWSWSRRVIDEATPESLGMIRIIVCVILGWYTLYDGMPSIALLPRDLIGERGQGVMTLFRLIPGFRAAEASPTALRTFQVTGFALLMMGAAGLWTRWVIPLAAIGYTINAGLLRTPYYFFHTGIAPLYTLVTLCFTPCGDGLSLDRYFRKKRLGVIPKSSPSLLYGWARFGCWMSIALIYFSAGLSKVVNSGLHWADANSLRAKTIACTLDPMTFHFDVSLRLVDAPEIIFWLIGVGTLVIEFGMILTPFSRLARMIFPLGCVGMHVGIMLMQNLWFFDLMLVQLIYWEPEKWLGLTSKAAGPSSAVAAEAPKPVKSSMVAIILSLMIAMATCDVNQLEYYPMTAWGMFSQTSDSPSTAIQYHKLWVIYEDGTIEKANPDYQISAAKETRYRHYFWTSWKTAEGVRQLDQFLRLCGGMKNASRGDGPRVVAYKLEQHEWDWKADPKDPNHGHVIKTHEVKVDP